MSKVLYECNKCGRTFINNGHRDGLNCDKCKGSLIPLGYVDEFQNSIDAMKDKIENSDKQYMLNKKSKVKDLTIKINLDTTELDSKLNRIEKQLERIKSLEDTLKFSKDFNEVKNITINNNADIKDIMKRCVEAVMSMEPLQ
ncbi:non-transporter ABC protein [Clostridium sporogenes]|uniref:non-transporter ABC protein n=1 Tax=Clostridium sporogenes TaxID=1509 RepID=UPI002237BBF4|nr:non-transporter ABC protein [Clostridium sporogenes]MCW6059770.1 non-transporter ABC protein [Clostridium sporogenes]MCW6067277.1 non-transporter ABC protein [Clostridium sporogenes]